MRVGSIFFVLISALVSAQNTGQWYEVDGGYWEVPPSILQEIEPLLQSAANAESEKKGIKVPNLTSYVIQYQGVVAKYQGVMQGADRSVVMRGACEIPEDSTSSLSERWYLEFDGSECYFGAIYDPASKQLKLFSFFE